MKKVRDEPALKQFRKDPLMMAIRTCDSILCGDIIDAAIAESAALVADTRPPHETADPDRCCV